MVCSSSLGETPHSGNSSKIPGPVVRINPGEVHCNDMDFSDEIYAVGGRKRDKSLHQTNGAA